MKQPLNIAVVCNYKLFKERIGSMDRFYKLFDEKCKQKGYNVIWFFSDYQPFDFYKNLNIHTVNNTSVEEEFINYSKVTNTTYDVIITHFVQLCTPFFKQFKAIHNKSFIIAVNHNANPLEGVALKKRIKNLVKGFLYSKYIDHFVGVSNYSKHVILHDFGKYLKHKTKTVYNGVDTDVFKTRLENNTTNNKKFIVVSHLTKNKGIQDLFLALNELDITIQNKIFVDIYGKGPFKDTLVKMRDNFKLKNVKFKGSSSSINEELQHYDYLIQPTYMECFSLSILESLAANVPVITTTVGGNLEVLEDNKNGFIFNPADFKALAVILKNVITGNKSINENVSDKIKQHFNIDTMVDKYIKLLPCT